MQAVVQTFLSWTIHALAFFLAAQLFYVSMHVDQLRPFLTEPAGIDPRSLSGFLFFLPAMFLSAALVPALKSLRAVGDKSRLLLLGVCVMLAYFLLAPAVHAVPSWIPAAKESRDLGSTKLLRANQGVLLAMIVVGMIYYLFCVFTISDHLNHLFTLATSGLVGVVVIMLVFGCIFASGVTLWANPAVFSWVMFLVGVLLYLLPYWSLQTSALGTPMQMIRESLAPLASALESAIHFLTKSPAETSSTGDLFVFLILLAHFLQFFVVGKSGWKQLESFSLAWKVVAVAIYLGVAGLEFGRSIGVANWELLPTAKQTMPPTIQG